MKPPTPHRCSWVRHEIEIPYHDTEWGVPLRDDRALFELLNLEGAQAGLSWHTILKKRESYRQAFDNFDPQRMARYTPATIEKLLTNPGIVRNRLKVNAAVTNARAYLALLDSGTTLSHTLWSIVDHTPINNHVTNIRSIPPRTPHSDRMSKMLSNLGFKFVGSTICYAFMQASGMVNDHETSCFRHKPCSKLR
jgi:DNA-3-methyladenine glycosylase I